MTVLRACAKALVAAAVAFTVAGGVILAAVADDHVTTTEWVTIALALVGALASPAGVYATRNASVEPPSVTAGETHRDHPGWWTEPL